MKWKLGIGILVAGMLFVVILPLVHYTFSEEWSERSSQAIRCISNMRDEFRYTYNYEEKGFTKEVIDGFLLYYKQDSIMDQPIEKGVLVFDGGETKKMRINYVYDEIVPHLYAFSYCETVSVRLSSRKDLRGKLKDILQNCVDSREASGDW